MADVRDRVIDELRAEIQRLSNEARPWRLAVAYAASRMSDQIVVDPNNARILRDADIVVTEDEWGRMVFRLVRAVSA